MRKRVSITKHSAVRLQQPLDSGLEKKLIAYAGAAAGVALLVVVPAAEASVVYTATNVKLQTGSNYPIDLNHDGISDFSLALFNINHSSFLQVNLDVTGNAAVAAASYRGDAAALALNAPIGSRQKFISVNNSYGGVFMAAAGMYDGSHSNGPWIDKVKQFLGFKFLINGEVHFGWARLTVPSQFENYKRGVVLTGYAYETVANRPIRAGATSDGARSVTWKTTGLPMTASQTASLGMLAGGADAMPAWRREQLSNG